MSTNSRIGILHKDGQALRLKLITYSDRPELPGRWQ